MNDNNSDDLTPTPTDGVVSPPLHFYDEFSLPIQTTNNSINHSHNILPFFEAQNTDPLLSKSKEKRDLSKGEIWIRRWRKRCRCISGNLRRRKLIRAICFAEITSGVASWTNLFAKAGVDLFTSGFTEPHLYRDPLVWVLIVSAVPLVLIQLRLLAKMFSSL